jgi:hypothetical protein
MIGRKFVFLASAALAVLSLVACGGSSSDVSPAYCPTPFTVTDAGRLTHFKDGPGRDPRDIAYEAVVAGSRTSCEALRNQINVTLVMRISVSAGPSVGAGPTRVPYFVRVIDASGAIVQGQEFTADFRLSASNPRGTSQEELSLSVPLDGSYRIAIGLKPTAEELNYNRRGRQ